MKLIHEFDNVETMLSMYRYVAKGHYIRVRGSETMDRRDVAIVFDASKPIITNFVDRKFNLLYAKREWLWYLTADPKNRDIERYADAWKKLQQPDGTYFSNYGQYIFGTGDSSFSQFSHVLSVLRNDSNSRRASIVLLKKEHLTPENPDVVCTYAINFYISAMGQLHMTVMMRSNDVIWGFTNDAFCFSNLYMFMYTLLKGTYPGLLHGQYTHIVNSLHVYDRHFEMIRRIVETGRTGYSEIPVPTPSTDEIGMLIVTRGRHSDGPYVQWLKAE